MPTCRSRECFHNMCTSTSETRRTRIVSNASHRSPRFLFMAISLIGPQAVSPDGLNRDTRWRAVTSSAAFWLPRYTLLKLVVSFVSRSRPFFACLRVLHAVCACSDRVASLCA